MLSCRHDNTPPFPFPSQKTPGLICHFSNQGVLMLAEAAVGSCWQGFSWKPGKKSQSEKKHFIPAWERKPRSAFSLLQPRSQLPQVSLARSLQPGSSLEWVGREELRATTALMGPVAVPVLGRFRMLLAILFSFWFCGHPQ